MAHTASCVGEHLVEARMARRTLDVEEVALIKAMIGRGMRNTDIQFYFNRPDRPVNSGRISEIRNGDKWGDVEAASPEDLEEFFAAEIAADMPEQLLDAVVFTVDQDGRIAVSPDPPALSPAGSPEQTAIYNELRDKTADILSAGHNSLGLMYDPIHQFLNVLTADISQASTTLVWLRGNKLRSILRAHDETRHLSEGHPTELDKGYAERLRDIVDTFNIFVLGDPKGQQLDQKRLGPQDRNGAVEELVLARPITDNSAEIATPKTVETLNEHLNAAEAAPNTINGDQVVALARDTSSNFVNALLRNGFFCAKRILGDEFSTAWKAVKIGVYTSPVGIFIGYPEATIAFVVQQSQNISMYVKAAIDNPIVMQIIEFIVKVFG